MYQHIESRLDQQDNKKLHLKEGRIYFSKETERKFFFVLTLIMLLLGACFKLGVWQ